MQRDQARADRADPPGAQAEHDEFAIGQRARQSEQRTGDGQRRAFKQEHAADFCDEKPCLLFTLTRRLLYLQSISLYIIVTNAIGERKWKVQETLRGANQLLPRGNQERVLGASPKKCAKNISPW